MENSIRYIPADTNAYFSENDSQAERRTYLQLAFIGTLFLTSWTIGALRMSDMMISSQGVSLLGTLLGM